VLLGRVVGAHMISISLLERTAVCTSCRQELSVNAFYLRNDKQGHSRHGERRTICKKCDGKRKTELLRRDPIRRARTNQRHSEAYYRNAEQRKKKLEAGKIWREQHPDLKGYMNAAAKRHYQRNVDRMREKGREAYWKDPEAAKAATRIRNYKKLYGLTEEGFLSLLQAQKEVCAICGLPESRKFRGKVTRLAVDHCHKTGRVRGLLCVKCNLTVAMFESVIDNTGGIDEAVKRLRAYLGK